MLFLDFSKAYDRMHRGWIQRCLQRLGFGTNILRWVQLLHAGTQAGVLFNGWTSSPFPIRSGVAQGSPLSPLLYNAAVQPLASLMRKLQCAGTVPPILLPDGSPAPPTHQHADDTTIHTSSVAGARAALDQGISVFCAATCARLNIAKTKGIVLGSHPPLHGVDPSTNVTFVSPDTPVKHLGLLLTADPATFAAAADSMYAKRISTMRATATHWSHHSLTFPGRVAVAKQVLAAQFTYHLSYIPPSPASATSITHLLRTFTNRGTSLPEDGTLSSTQSHPHLHISSLPRRAGGMGVPDLGVMGQALMGKVVAQLLHPRRHPWKILASHQLHRHSPPGTSLDLRLPLSTAPVPPALGPRWCAYIPAFQATLPHRRVPFSQQSFYSAMTEPIFYNPAIVHRSSGAHLRPAQLSNLPTLTHLRDLRSYLQHHLSTNPPTPLPSSITHLLSCLPPSWLAWVQCAHPPSTDWWCTADAFHVRWRLDNMLIYQVSRDGQLQLLPALPATAAAPQWEPCCIFAPPDFQPQPPSPDGIPSPLPSPPLYFVGPWRSVSLDPTVWGLGRAPITSFTVKLATTRILTHRMQQRELREGRQFFAGWGVTPRLWRDLTLPPPAPPLTAPGPSALPPPPTALPVDLATIATLTTRGTGTRRSRADFDAVDYGAPSLTPPSPRPARGERQLLPPTTLALETLDLLAAPPGVRPSTPSSFWTALARAGLPREVHALAWRLAHAALFCGAYYSITRGHPAGHAEGHCKAAGCTSTLETWSHMFFSCPTVRPAVLWFLDFWGSVSGLPPPDLPAVIVAGHPAAYVPPAGSESLWLWARLLFLHSIWRLRCRRQALHSSFTATDIVALFIGRLRRQIKLDFFRATSDLPALSGCCPLWFGSVLGGKFEIEEFKALWGFNGVLATVSGGDDTGLSLQVLLSTSHPLPLPPP